MSLLHPSQFLLSQYPIPSLPTFDSCLPSPPLSQSTPQPSLDISESRQNVLLKIKLLSSLGFKPQEPLQNNTKPALLHKNELEKRGQYKGEQASTEPTSPLASSRKPSDAESEEEEEEIFLKVFQRTDLDIRKGYIERLSYRQTSHIEMIQEKTSSQMRQEYLSRLVNMKILKLEPAKKHQTILIFDWDDTLLCTTFVKEHEDFLPYETILGMLNALDLASSELLSKATEYGEVFIITNADEGWVEESAGTFLPRVLEVLQEKKIKIISARKGYESRYPSEVGRWKMEAFLSIKRYFDSQVITNIICIGDQLTEIDAAYLLAQQFKRSIIKTIKFKERPKPDELVKEVKLVINKLEGIYVALNHLKIRMEKKTITCNGGGAQ